VSKFTLSIFDPNTLLPHRAGIAGLALALGEISPKDAPLTWKVTEDSVTLDWDGIDLEVVSWLMGKTYTIQDGLLVAPALNLSKLSRYPFSKGVLDTFLQFSSGNKGFSEDQQDLVYSIEDTEISIKCRSLLWCYYTDSSKLTAFTKKGHFKTKIELTSKHLPGLIQDFGTSKCYAESPYSFLALLFLPLACSYFQLPFVKHPDPKKKTMVPTYAVVIPEVINLLAWRTRRRELSEKICRSFRTSSASESGLKVLLQEKTVRDFEIYQTKYCEVYQIGPQQWDKNQIGLKQAIYRIESNDEVLQIYGSVANIFKPIERKTENGEVYVLNSKISPWITNNLVLSKCWYLGFYEFMKKRLDPRKPKSENNPQIYKLERKGLVKMTQYHLSSEEHILFNAVKGAFGRYLRKQIEEITQRQKRQFDYKEYDHVREKVIRRLQRFNTQQGFATALVDFLSQFPPKAAKGLASEIMSLLYGSDWKRARDLTMLAIATYQGKKKVDDAGISDPDAIVLPEEPDIGIDSDSYSDDLLVS
jgi:CRISPR-associated protein Cas8a1/Csx13